MQHGRLCVHAVAAVAEGALQFVQVVLAARYLSDPFGVQDLFILVLLPTPRIQALLGFCADFKQQIFLMQAACFVEVVIIASLQRSQLVLMAELLIWGGCVILCVRSCRLQDVPVTGLWG